MFRRILSNRKARFLIPLIGLMILPLLLMAFPQSAHAQAACPTSGRDYGDAPSSYGIACATPASNLYIGPVVPTAVSYSVCAPGAACDSADNFLNPLTPIDVSNSTYVWNIPVTNTTGSAVTLAGWIDLNGNNQFDAGERVTANVPSGGSTLATLTWNTSGAAFTGTVYARLRLSPNANVDAINDYGNGEVEDYAVELLTKSPCDPGTSFYYIQGTGSTGNAVIASVNATTGITTFVNDPPTPANGLLNINGLAIDAAKGLIYFQDAADNSTPRGIFGYNLLTGTNFTVTSDVTGAPLSIPLSNGWQTGSGAYANGRYYAGIDGDDTGTIYEITFNAAGTAPVSARLLFTPPLYPANCVGSLPPGGINCRNYGDLIVAGNKMYVTLWTNFTSPQSQILYVYDINSRQLLSQQIISESGFAFQLARDGNGQVYAITSENGRIYRITNDQIAGFPTTGLVSTIGAIINDGSECVFTRTPTAVQFSSFSAQVGVFDGASRVIAIGVIGAAVVAAAFVLTDRRRSHQARR